MIVPDAGCGFNISLPAATFLLRGGVGVITGLGAGLDLIPGAHLGGGALIHLDQRLAFRADLPSDGT